MIFGLTWLDAVLLVLLVMFFVQGHRRGLGVVLGNLAGFIAGALIAFLAVPVVSQWATGTGWRWVLTLVTVVALVASGQYVGAAIGAQLRLRIGPPVLRRVDRLLGALASVLVAALVMGLLSFSLGALGNTAVTREVARSRVLTTVDAAMPDAVLSWAARARAAVAGLDGLPEVELPAPADDADAPDLPPVTAALGSGATGSGGPDAAAVPGSSAAAPGGEPSGGAAPADTPGAARPGEAGTPGDAGTPGEPGSATSADDSAGAGPAPLPSTPAQGEPGASQPGAPEPDAAPSRSQPDAPADPASSAPAPAAAASSPTTAAARPSGPAAAPQPAPAADVSRSVVRLTGTATACAQVQSGSGVAIAPDRVLTNAHVVAGVPAPTVLDRDRGVYAARVVLLDTARDLAVLAVDGAQLPVARLGAELGVGDTATAMGYPDSGPFATTAARVQAVGEVPLEAVGGGAVSAVDVYTLEADIRHGYSGGPVVAEDGTLAGLVFARAPGSGQIGYALTADAIARTVAVAPSLSSTVSAGQCVVGG